MPGHLLQVAAREPRKRLSFFRRPDWIGGKQIGQPDRVILLVGTIPHISRPSDDHSVGNASLTEVGQRRFGGIRMARDRCDARNA